MSVELSKKITKTWLRNLGACNDGLDEFSELFPRGVVPSKEAFQKFSLDSVNWLVHELFNKNKHYFDIKNTANTIRSEAFTKIDEFNDKFWDIYNSDKCYNTYGHEVDAIRKVHSVARINLRNKANETYKTTMINLAFDIIEGKLQ